MYIPEHTKIEPLARLHEFMQSFSFATLVSPGLTATHLPLLLKPEEGKHGILYGHFARANPHWKHIEGQSTLVIFNGPHSYISPSWYHKHPAVPTWNYAAVHAYGTVSLLNDEETAAMLEHSMSHYDPELLHQPEIVSQQLRERLLAAIVGFSITLTHVEGVQKLGQHRSQRDQQSVFEALGQSKNPMDRALAEYMEQQSLGTGKL
ncbi:FMN-binding negative transcriptional regulator [Alteromonas aestuariivivens]|uniref:FMN-binding negative transcriptional regulator n=1 Tax=Alteromonas aestuariivivens TaxID=1938339 RepID=A0A3D8MAU8_9ALTE|nr:FMN-binding negative transcriptional regulator [Alteromonas aestuariivivens]RDV26818.1 FMN-binding negative transcriptional regulator [Alteromonas aestuariivivens]